MPTYEYRCHKCGETYEIFQSFSDKPLRRHVGCGGAVEKVFHPRGVVFKGSGFYVTDSRSKSDSTNGGGKTESEKKDASKKKESTSSSSGVAADKSAVSSKATHPTESAGD